MYNIELRMELVSYAKKMYESHLVQATQGNVSIRDRKSGLICITPSGADYQTLTAEDIVVVDEEGNVVEGKWRPSIETPLHTLILRRRRDIHCVMHTHSPYATAFGVVYEKIPIVLSDSALCLGGEVPIAPYRMSGTTEFAEGIAEVLGDGFAVIWGNHGVMVVGVGLAQAFAAAHALEDNAKVYTIAKQIGNPVLLAAEEVKKLHAFWMQNYRQRELE
ncbi:MAG: class II aldolase/adducin family protein [Ktedonobacteraceae bacterium]|nr:class II aldolase/adducin family protein [Ktedonobacteraceae bacterium]